MLAEHKQKYNEKNLITFGLSIDQEFHEGTQTWKKKLYTPKNWIDSTLETKLRKMDTCLGIITGKTNDIFVIDVDSVDDWTKLLKKYKQTEPNTVKAISGSGGFHLFFKYDDKLENIKSTSKSISEEYDIDVRTNGGFIIIPPSSYFNKNTDSDAVYTWSRSIFEYELLDLPGWLFKLLNDKTITIKPAKKNIKKPQIMDLMLEQDNDNQTITQIEEKNVNNEIEKYNNVTYDENEIMTLVNMLGKHRYTYNEWLTVGICLHNINFDYLYIWDNWSKKDSRYESGKCEEKWVTFNQSNALYVGSLIFWAKTDNPIEFKKFMNHQAIKKVINHNKQLFPKNELQIDKIISNDMLHYIALKDLNCPIYKNKHETSTVYMEMFQGTMVAKCHICVGKIFPCKHIQLNEKDAAIINNTLNIENLQVNIYNNGADEIIDIEQEDIFEDKILNKLIFESLDGAPYRLAAVLYHINKHIYNYGEDSKWYKFKGHQWSQIKTKIFCLRNLISISLADNYKKLVNYFSDKGNELKVKKIKKIIDNFDDTKCKNDIMSELTEIFAVNNNGEFLEKLDDNPYLIGFKNGIYDLKNKEFRDGRSDDYVSMSVGYDYSSKYSDKIKDIKKFFEDIIPNESEREYLLTLIGSFLAGENRDESLNIFTGGLRNGKSTLSNILMYVFGDYYCDIQNNLLTRERPSANTPQPEIMELIKKRIVLASENEGNQKINTGFIKQLTGNDRCKGRSLYSNDQITYIPKFKLILLCNDIPEVDKPNDIAFWNRCKCLNFPILFTDNPMNENEKQINKNLKNEIKEWKQDCMLLFLEYYEKYEKNGLKITEDIKKATLKYQKNNNPYADFVTEYITKNTNEYIVWTNLKESYIAWYKNNIGSNVPKVKDIKEYFEKKIFKTPESIFRDGQQKYRGWPNWKLTEE